MIGEVLAPTGIPPAGYSEAPCFILSQVIMESIYNVTDVTGSPNPAYTDAPASCVIRIEGEQATFDLIAADLSLILLWSM